jgi:dUTP pyrophosphatase
MQLKYKKLSSNAYSPIKKRFTDAGIDFCLSRPLQWEKTTAGFFATAHTDLAMEIPQGYYLATAPRSSMLFKNHIAVFHSIIDTGYTGEITFYLHYIGDKNDINTLPKVSIGDRIAQCVLIQTPIIHTEFQEVDELPSWSDRGDNGFGSTGK